MLCPCSWHCCTIIVLPKNIQNVLKKATDVDISEATQLIKVVIMRVSRGAGSGDWRVFPEA